MRKIYISFDFEGIAGVTNWKETNQNKKFEELATEQINAFCDGIYKADSDTEIVIADAHGMGDNIHWELLRRNVRLIRGCPRNKYMIQNLDDSYTHLVLFGYHTGIGQTGMMDHTYSGSSIYNISINDEPMDEMKINAYFAAEIGVPVSFIFGDDKTIEAMTPVFPYAEMLVSKYVISRFSAEMIDRKSILERLFEAGKSSIEKAYPLPKRNYPLDVKIDFSDTLRSYLCAVIPNVEQISPRTIQFHCTSYREFYRYLMTCVYVCAGAKNF